MPSPGLLRTGSSQGGSCRGMQRDPEGSCRGMQRCWGRDWSISLPRKGWGSWGCPAVCAATQANNTNFNAQEPLALFIALQIMQELLFLINTGCWRLPNILYSDCSAKNSFRESRSSTGSDYSDKPLAWLQQRILSEPSNFSQHSVSISCTHSAAQSGAVH